MCCAFRRWSVYRLFIFPQVAFSHKAPPAVSLHLKYRRAKAVIVHINKGFLLHPILSFRDYDWVEDIIISLKGKWGRAWNNIYITPEDEGGWDRTVRFTRANDFSFFSFFMIWPPNYLAVILCRERKWIYNSFTPISMRPQRTSVS